MFSSFMPVTLFESRGDVRTLHRLLVAVRPPPTLAAQIGRVRDSVLPTGRAVADDRLHITLSITNDHPIFPVDLAARMGETLSSISPPSARVVFDRLIAGRGSMLLAPSEPVRGLMALQGHVGTALLRAGIAPRARWRFSPHITLGYGGGAGFDLAIDPISWRIGELVLIHSLVGQGRHVTLGRWPLTDERRS